MVGASRGRPVALLALVSVVGSAVTAVLSLDATVVLLTPAVFTAVARLRLRPKPHVYACTHLANSASLLLLVSNLTNLLALRASGLSFARFGALMALPWLAAIGVEWLVLRRRFAADLVGRGRAAADPAGGAAPRYAMAVLALTLAGFAVTSAVGLGPGGRGQRRAQPDLCRLPGHPAVAAYAAGARRRAAGRRVPGPGRGQRPGGGGRRHGRAVAGPEVAGVRR
jgi:arsenical pump membrane protein